MSDDEGKQDEGMPVFSKSMLVSVEIHFISSSK